MSNVSIEIDKINRKLESMDRDMTDLKKLFEKVIDLMDTVNAVLSDHSNYDSVTDRMSKLEHEFDGLKLDLAPYLEKEEIFDGES